MFPFFWLCCRAFLLLSFCVFFSSGVGPILGGVGGDTFFEAGAGQGHQRHNQPSGVYVPQRELCVCPPSVFTCLIFDLIHRAEEKSIAALDHFLLEGASSSMGIFIVHNTIRSLCCIRAARAQHFLVCSSSRLKWKLTGADGNCTRHG